jgi:hypothetical protein
VDDLDRIARLGSLRPGLEFENVVQRGLGPFDLRTEERLLADVHRQEQIRVLKKQCDGVEASQLQGGLVQQLFQLRRAGNRRIGGERIRDERRVIRDLLDVPSRARSRGVRIGFRLRSFGHGGRGERPAVLAVRVGNGPLSGSLPQWRTGEKCQRPGADLGWESPGGLPQKVDFTCSIRRDPFEKTEGD